MRILALSSWWPEPADNGSRLRISRLLHALAQEHEVHLVALSQEPVTQAQIDRLSQTCTSVAAVPQLEWTRRRTDTLGSLLKSEPASLRATYNRDYAAIVRARAATLRPDLVIALEINAAPYAEMVVGVPRVLEGLEVAGFLDRCIGGNSARARLRAYATWWKQRSYMRQLLHSFDACTAVSGREQSFIRYFAPASCSIVVIPNGADVHDDDPPSKPEVDTLIYPGALSYDANYDAMEHFLRTSFPIIRQARPETRLRITGRNTSAQREALTVDGVEWTGYIPDVRPVVASSWAEVVPLRRGGGTRLKVLEALALGTPVISTPKGVEGLELHHARHVLIADSPHAFADATIRLLSRPDLRAHLAAAGRRIVREKYDWQVIGGSFNELVREVGTKRLHIR